VVRSNVSTEGANPTLVMVAIGAQREEFVALHLLPSITEMVLSQ
jgi:hypothetical protein